MRVGMAFPGQGVPAPDVVACLERHQDTAEIAALAAHIGTDRWGDLDLRDTRVAQPVVYSASVVAAAALEAHGPFDLALGHSLGEISALVFAGALSFEAGLDLVAVRASLSGEASDRRRGEMVAIMGLDEHDVEFARRIAIARTAGVLEIAAVNGRQQTVVTGEVEAVDAMIEVAAELGGIANRLPIGGAFHSPLMVPSLDRFREALAAVTFGQLRIPVASPTDCRVHDDSAAFAGILAKALVVPVRWVPLLQALRAQGVASLVEAGPGRTLEKLGRRTPVIPFVATAAMT